MWFEELMGFREDNAEQIYANIVVDGQFMTSKANGRTYKCGQLETPTLGELRTRVSQQSATVGQGRLKLSEMVADVQRLHQDPACARALFQVASQFNLLEMVSPSITPEAGIGIYEHDHTQGPACAIAAGAGTVFRNYFVLVNGRTGQTTDNQIDCLLDLGQALGNHGNRLWTMRNGYVLPSANGLLEVAEKLSGMSESERDALRAKLRIGIHWDTEVTLGNKKHLVSQAFCSALPVAYSPLPVDMWEDFGRLVLEASYEATLCAAVLNLVNGSKKSVFLTLLGGGAFGNPDDWIFSAIERAVKMFENADLEVAVVSYGSSKRRVQELVKSFNAAEE